MTSISEGMIEITNAAGQILRLTEDEARELCRRLSAVFSPPAAVFNLAGLPKGEPRIASFEGPADA